MTRNIPATTRKPLAIPLAMSDAPPEATSSSAPFRHTPREPEHSDHEKPVGDLSRRPSKWPRPKLRFLVEDLVHEGAVRFFDNAVPSNILSDAITIVLNELYWGGMPTPPVRSISLILHSFDGVAYTKGMDLDNDHKELHFSLKYIAGIDASTSTRLRDEIRGVIIHEMVHAWQWNAKGTCPGGLIEGIADFVRLRATLAPPHWIREKGGSWDEGYARTAYFLDWLEGKFGRGTVAAMNGALRVAEYDEDNFWQGLFRLPVKQLWKCYQQSFDEKTESEETRED